MAEEKFDVIIIGGGLAGLATAIQLSKANRSVLVVEKNSYPFHKVCGEYISMESWDFLERLGVPLSEMNLPRIRRLRVSSVSGNHVEHALGLGGFGISRYTLDNMMATIAKENGATVLENHRAEDITFQNDQFDVLVNGKNIKSTLVIGAFGKRSNLDKKLDRKIISQKQNWIGVKYHTKADLPDDMIELHNFDGGYCGISKVDGEKYCLCYLTLSDNLKKANNSIAQMEGKILSQNPLLENYFSKRGNFLFAEPVTISQINFENKLPVENHVVMMGDAAGMIAPLCGNGMSMALHAAAMSLIVIENFLAGNISRHEMESEYASRWKRLFSARLKMGRQLQPLLVKSSLSKPTISVLKRFPFLLSPIIRATHGKPF